MADLKIRFGVSFWIFVAVAIALKQGGIAISYFAAVLLHEISHYVVAKRMFYRCKEIRVSLFGAVLYGDFADVAPRDRIAIALAGPLANVTACCLCLALWWSVPAAYVFTQYFFATNLSMAVVNLLPCYPLDGGRIVSGLVEKYTTKAIKYVKVSTWIVASGMFAVFVVSLFVGENLFSVGLFALGLLGGVVGEGTPCYTRASCRYALERKHGMEKKTLVFTVDSTLANVAKRLRGNYLFCVEVVDKDLNIVGRLSVAQTEKALFGLPCNTKVVDALKAVDLL